MSYYPTNRRDSFAQEEDVYFSSASSSPDAQSPVSPTPAEEVVPEQVSPENDTTYATEDLSDRSYRNQKEARGLLV